MANFCNFKFLTTLAIPMSSVTTQLMCSKEIPEELSVHLDVIIDYCDKMSTRCYVHPDGEVTVSYGESTCSVSDWKLLSCAVHAVERHKGWIPQPGKIIQEQDGRLEKVEYSIPDGVLLDTQVLSEDKEEVSLFNAVSTLKSAIIAHSIIND